MNSVYFGIEYTNTPCAMYPWIFIINCFQFPEALSFIFECFFFRRKYFNILYSKIIFFCYSNRSLFINYDSEILIVMIFTVKCIQTDCKHTE